MRTTSCLFAAVLISLTLAGPLFAQRRAPVVPCQPCLPGQPGMPTDPNQPQPSPDQSTSDARAQDTSDQGGRGAILASGTASLPGLVGGAGGVGNRPILTGGNAALLTSGIKVLEGDTLIPIDRVYIAFTYTAGLVQDTTLLGGQLARFNQYRELMGIEKTFFNDRASVTLRVPVSTIHSDDFPFSSLSGGTGTSTIVGDGSLVFKAILHENPERGTIFTAGLEFSFPTSTTYYASDGVPSDTRDWVLQPYLGSILRCGELTFQDATGFGFPTSGDHSIYFFTSNSAAWTFYRAADPKRLVSSMSSIAELFILEPFTHRDTIAAINHTADFISVSIGNSIVLRQRFYFTFGVSYPLTGAHQVGDLIVPIRSGRFTFFTAVPTVAQHPYGVQAVTSVSIRY